MSKTKNPGAVKRQGEVFGCDHNLYAIAQNKIQALGAFIFSASGFKLSFTTAATVASLAGLGGMLS